MSFPHATERWRASARKWSAVMAARYGVALDEHDVLALVHHESKGNPTTISHSGCRGLGQFAHGTLGDYNKENPGWELSWAQMIDPAAGDGQIRAVCWLLASSRRKVLAWSVPDRVLNQHLWADLRYGWGPGNTKDAIAAYRAKHGQSPTFAQLEADSKEAYDEDNDGRIDIRPFKHARGVAKLAAADRAEGKPIIPFPALVGWTLVVVLGAVVAGLAVCLVLWWQARKGRANG